MADSLSGEREEKRLWDVFSLEVEKNHTFPYHTDNT